MSHIPAMLRRLDRRLMALAAALTALVVFVGWASAAQVDRMVTVVPANEALDGIASRLGYDLNDHGGAPGSDQGVSWVAVPGGGVLVAPVEAAGTANAMASEWRVHFVGLLAEITGVFMSFWLARAAGMVPGSLKGQILGLSLVLGVVSYSTANAATVVGPVLTPQHVFASVKDGFVWAAAFPMFARAFGLASEDLAGAPDSAGADARQAS